MTYFKARDVLGLCVILLVGCGESSDSGKSDGAGGRTGAIPDTKATGAAGSTMVGSGGASAGTTTVPATGGAAVTQAGAGGGGVTSSAGSSTGGVVATGGVVSSQAGGSMGGIGAAGAGKGGAAIGGTAAGGIGAAGTSTGGSSAGGAEAGNTSVGGIAGSAGSGDAVAGNGNVGGTAGAAGADDGQAGNAGADPLGECFPSNITTPNVVVLKDATPSNADSEGRMWIGGNLTMSGSYSINSTTMIPTSCSEYGLIVGGNISGSPIVDNGKVAYGGTFTGNSFAICGVFHTSVLDFATLGAQLKTYSAALAALPPNGTTSTSGSLVLTGSSNSLNVFNLTTAQIAANSLSFVAPTGSTILVNISGTTANWTGKMFSFPDGAGTCKAGTSAWCHKVLYNFYEATSLYVSGIGVQGTILAPYATLDGGGGNVDGQVFVNNLKGGIEYHPYLFTGCLKP